MSRGNLADGVWVYDGKQSLDSKIGKSLRHHFDKIFSDPKGVKNPAELSSRFVWDYWNVPDQYTLLRTPAAAFFGPKLFDQLTQNLLKFGRSRFGCTGLTPPWLSAYVEGCHQGFHVDMPHGPLAYVYSLTLPGPFHFKGGETQFLNPDVLNYWKNYDQWNGAESEKLLGTIPPAFGRLSVFDPRIPHGVSRVEGTHDIRQARLVIHGWFSNPQPAIIGPLSAAKASDGIEEILSQIDPGVEDLNLRGMVSFSFKILASGKVASVKTLVSTLQGLEGPVDGIEKKMEEVILDQKFAQANGPTEVTIPILFE